MASSSRPSLFGVPASYVWPWVLVSLLIHLALVLRPVVFVDGSQGGRALQEGGGEVDGHGFAGDAVDFIVAGPDRDAPMQGATPTAEDHAPGAVPTAPRAEVQEQPEPSTLEAPERTASWRMPRRAEPEEGEPAVEAPVEQAAQPGDGEAVSRATDSEEPAAAGPEENTPSGMDAEESTSGAPAGVAERAILGSLGLGGDLAGSRELLMPNGGMCEDPAAGVWRTQRYDPGRRQWVRFTLRIRHDGAGRLRGTIENHSFSGGPGQPRPGPCTAFGFDQTWRMPARGRYDDGEMVFEARSVRLVRQDCPSSNHIYYPDRFSGTVRPLQDRFDAVNNDGHLEFNRPYTFRRVSCE